MLVLSLFAIGVGENLSEDLQRGVPVEGFAWPAVEAVGDGVEVILRVDGQIRALGQVLAQQSVGIFAGAALPGAVRVAEVHTHAGGGSQLIGACQ